MKSGIATKLVLAAAVAAVIVGGSLICAASDTGFHGLTEKAPLQVDRKAREVRILAELQPAAFSGGWIKRTPNYHAVVWKEGRAAGEALLASYANDASVYDALVEIGGVPGNNLNMAAWNDRKDPKSRAPDERVNGSPVDIFVWWPNLSRPLPLRELLIDPSGRGIDMRFGGNKALIPEWRSGCIVCLYSCPGGKVSNHAYTIRDYVKGSTKFAVNFSRVPRGKTRAVVILRLHGA